MSGRTEDFMPIQSYGYTTLTSEQGERVDIRTDTML